MNPLLQAQSVAIIIALEAAEGIQRLVPEVLLDIAVEEGSAERLTIGLLRKRSPQRGSLSVGIQKPALQRGGGNPQRDFHLDAPLGGEGSIEASDES